MAYSQIVKVGDGVTTQFALNFALGYLKQSDVTCRVGDEVDGSGNPVFRDLTWIDESLVQVSGAPAGVGVLLLFTRTVDITVLQHDYANGSAIIEENLDESFEQALMAVQQIADGRFGTYQQDLDMGNFRIKNMNDGADPQDAVNKRQLDAISIVSGNVPIPASGNVGQFLKATATSVFGWVSLVYSDISALLSGNAAQVRSDIGLQSGATTTVGTAATRDVGTNANNVVALDGSAKLPAVDGSQLTNLNASVTSVRQTVLQGAVNGSGVPTFLGVGSGLAPTLDGSSTSVVMTAANGFNPVRTDDRIGVINSAVSFPALIGAQSVSTITNATTTATMTTAAAHNLVSGATITVSGVTPAAYNGTFQVTVVDATHLTYTMASNPGGNATVVGSYTVLSFLYGDIASNGAVTLGSTLLQPSYIMSGSFSTVSGQFVFNIGSMLGQVGNGSTSAQVYRVFIGEAVATAAVVSTILAYSLQGRFVSSISNSLPTSGTRVPYAANLGDTNNILTFAYVKCSTAGDGGWSVGVVLPAVINLATSAYQPAGPAIEDRNTLSVTAGANGSGWVAYARTTGSASGLTVSAWGLFVVAKRSWGGS